MNQQTSTPPAIQAQRLIRAAKIAAVCLVLSGAAAALHPPRYADGSQPSQDATLAECLRYLRTQVFVYAADHKGVSPGFPGNDFTQPADSVTFVEQMTGFSDSAGQASPLQTVGRDKGPYLAAIPANPLTLRSGVLIWTGDQAPRADESKPYGWFYNPITRQISPNVVGADSQGVSYASY